MPCDAIVYLPATIRQADTTLVFANRETARFFTNLLDATLRANLYSEATRPVTTLYGDNITAYLPTGILTIWSDGRIVIRPNAYALDGFTAQVADIVTAALASLTQLLTAQTIGAIAPITDTQFVGNNLVLTVNL